MYTSRCVESVLRRYSDLQPFYDRHCLHDGMNSGVRVNDWVQPKSAQLMTIHNPQCYKQVECFMVPKE